MKVAFVSSGKYIEYDSLIKEIVENVNNKLVKNKQEVEINHVLMTTRKKFELYFVITDDVEDFNTICSKIKPKVNPVLITKNLEEKYIRSVIFSVKDILYIKNNIDIITNRVVSIIGKMYA